ncbi:MAG: hypothetical protein J5956_11565 [Ruminococcus sp.]|nr:hypothetical protein [Ruminococcus sp.]
MITKRTENGVTTYKVQDAKGNAIELSGDVVTEIFFFKRREYHKEDIEHKLGEMYPDGNFSDEDIETATTTYEKYIGNDGSWNEVAEAAISDSISISD